MVGGTNRYVGDRGCVGEHGAWKTMGFAIRELCLDFNDKFDKGWIILTKEELIGLKVRYLL